MDQQILRPAKTADIEQLVSLLRHLFSIEEDFHFDAKRQRQGLQLLLDTPQAIVMTAEAKGLVVGMATGQVIISTAEGGLSLLVEDVVVEPAFHKRGIGSQLLGAVADWGRTQGARRMQLLADRTNLHALSFYEQRGWQQTRLICLHRYENQWCSIIPELQ